MRLKVVLVLVLLLLAFVFLLAYVRPALQPKTAPIIAPGVHVSAANVTAPRNLTVTVLPDTVNRYDYYAVSVIGAPNATFTMDVYGANGFHLSFPNRTDERGDFIASYQAGYDFGKYTVQISQANRTVFASVTVGCDARCQSAILQQNGQDAQTAIAAWAQFYGSILLVALVAFELPREVDWFRRRAADARARGVFSPREAFMAPWSVIRGHINPGDTVTDPKNVQNPRIAIDLRRRELLEQLHEATSRRYMEWNPDHIKALLRIVFDLAFAYDTQKGLQPKPAPYARPYARPALSEVKVTPAPKPAVRISDDHSPKPAEVSVAANGGDDDMNDELNKWDDLVSQAKRTSRRDRVIAAALFVVGAVLLVMAALVVAAYAGLHIAPLAALWVAWPGDPLKIILGFGLGATLVFGAWAWKRWHEPGRVPL